MGYSDSEAFLHEALSLMGFEVHPLKDRVSSLRVSSLNDNFGLIFSCGCRHLIKPELIESYGGKLINLHISLLPWNRGAHPNFWSFYDGTPSGISIHEVRNEVDFGPIVIQQELEFNPKSYSFAETYWILRAKIERLFMDNVESLVYEHFPVVDQMAGGSFHRSSELPADFRGWHSNIYTEIQRLKGMYSPPAIVINTDLEKEVKIDLQIQKSSGKVFKRRIGPSL